jgi:hypothetical protein
MYRRPEMIYCLFDDNEFFKTSSYDLCSVIEQLGYHTTAMAVPAEVDMVHFLKDVPRDAIVWIAYDGPRKTSAERTENAQIRWIQVFLCFLLCWRCFYVDV